MDKVAVITLIPFAVILYLKDGWIYDAKSNAFIFLNILVTLFLAFLSFISYISKTWNIWSSITI